MNKAMKDYVANNRETITDDRQLTRRRLAQGAAWSVPAVIATTAVPAYAASKQTGTATGAYLYTEIKSRTPAYCNTTSNPQQGYLSTVGTGNDPSVSVGLWAEGQAGTVQIDTATIRYVFNHPVALTAKPTGMTWSTATNLNGWTVTQPDRYTIQFSKNGITGEISTSALNTGTNFAGYFQNFKITDGCFGSGVVTVKTVATVVYTDKTGQHTYVKNTTGQGI